VQCCVEGCGVRAQTGAGPEQGRRAGVRSRGLCPTISLHCTPAPISSQTRDVSGPASLSAELVGEGSPDVIVRRLTHDALFQTLLRRRIDAARG
jgi:hypothetical protein